jgi:TPR repeat protein
MGSRNSCFSMGMMYRGGEGITRDPVKSKEYFGKACDMGDQESCGLAQKLPEREDASTAVSTRSGFVVCSCVVVVLQL